MSGTVRNAVLSAVIALVVAVVVIAAAPEGDSPTAPDQNNSTWDAIQTRGTLRIGVTQAPPWYFKDPATDEWSGLGVSIGDAMAESLGVSLEPVEVTWGTAVSALQANQIDTMFVLDATPARAVAIDFPAQPLLYYALAVLADDDLDIETWDDLNRSDISIAVTQGTTMDTYVTGRLAEATILRFPSNGEAVAAFQSERVNAVSLFHPPLIAMREKIGRGQIVLPAPIRQSTSSAGVRRESDTRWRDWVNTAISYYYQTGQTQVWYEDFLVSFGVDPDTVPAIRREDW
ncbi:MAG: transporter substrate-binding domain-containing protein [Alphaproteobacteria bacterium]|nr:transporter substrate-binding domain-containing protein [Alphaproteobacteria bacterium]MDA8001713.1 transporter substrate-binding domain-containing protein [Alphaproteobacteria bacterium]MDA8004599.1 transporter substrate-binding domain-containing protein [Alphaproteobacteria bacterium]MDA8006439.1 transporter substrate-binding domain-containing protein [Alphaproteobacteria bacterium]MDA8013510.1 transporter substrate-binding domain-containing protein [Alphaproteobacteria bacterium]